MNVPIARLLAGAASAAVILGAALPVVADSPAPGSVVPRGERVAGKTYPQWEIQAWRRLFKLPPHKGPCDTAEPGGHVFLLGGTGSTVCNVRVGDYVFLDVPTLDCSNLENPPYYGRTN